MAEVLDQVVFDGTPASFARAVAETHSQIATFYEQLYVTLVMGNRLPVYYAPADAKLVTLVLMKHSVFRLGTIDAILRSDGLTTQATVATAGDPAYMREWWARLLARLEAQGRLVKPESVQPPALTADQTAKSELESPPLATAGNSREPWRVPDTELHELARQWYEGHTATDIGQAIGLSPGTVRNKVTEGRKRYGEKAFPYHRK